MLDSTLQYLQAHQDLALAFILLIALAESLVVVGIIVPGVALLGAVTVAAANVGIPLWQVILAGWLGAIAGDTISYGCGYWFRQRLHGIWPFMQHPEWLTQGHAFFERHGGKSIFFGRFVGPVRPFIPAVAGMMGMQPKRFFMWNVVSASVWAPAYLVPPYLLGDTFQLKDWLNWKGLMVMAFLTAGALFFTWTLRQKNPKKR